MKEAAIIRTTAKKIRFVSSKTGGYLIGERKKSMKERMIKMPAARNGAYLQLRYMVMRRGKKYKIHMCRPSGVTASI